MSIEDLPDDVQKQMLAYRVFQAGDGAVVLDDLSNTFVRGLSDGLNEELEEIPHPYREYVRLGNRMVIQKIEMILEALDNQ